MSLRIDDIAPDLDCVTTQGDLSIHEYAGNSWLMLLSHPKDNTPVCLTELAQVNKEIESFDQRNCKVLAVSVDDISTHQRWVKDIEDVSQCQLSFPIIADATAELALTYEMLPSSAFNAYGQLIDNTRTVRTVYIIDPNKRVRAAFTYPHNVGRNVAELLRTIDALQITSDNSFLTPVNWSNGDHLLLSEENTQKGNLIYPGINYLRACPSFKNDGEINSKEYRRYTLPTPTTENNTTP